MTNEIVQIYDKIFKRIITLSSESVLAFIGGIFDKDFPEGSTITQNGTESIDDELHKLIADSIITINNNETYHIEVQIMEDNSIAFRVFDYGFQDAKKKMYVLDNRIKLTFPRPSIIYLEHNRNTPDEVILELNFTGQGIFEYRAPTVKFLDYSIEELRRRNMVILLPLYLLKVRRRIRREQSIDTANELKEVLNHNILDTLDECRNQGNITGEDYHVLIGLVHKLYEHLYGDIDIFKKEGVDTMLAEKLVLEHEIVREEEREKVMRKALEEKMESAREMIEIGMDDKIISKILRLPRDEIIYIRVNTYSK